MAKILIVEDEKNIREELNIYLKTAGYETAVSKIVQNGILLDVAAAKIEKDGKTEELTKNEVKILYCLFLHPGEIVSRTELIDYLWDNEVFIDDNTLSVNVTRIRDKLEKIGAYDVIETKRGLGYRV